MDLQKNNFFCTFCKKINKIILKTLRLSFFKLLLLLFDFKIKIMFLTFYVGSIHLHENNSTTKHRPNKARYIINWALTLNFVSTLFYSTTIEQRIIGTNEEKQLS
jgi:hypothetical protein